MSRGAAVTGAALFSGCLLISACGGGESAANSSAPGYGSAAHAGAEPTAAGIPGGPESGPGGQANGAATGQPAVVQTAHLAPASQSIIYTASLTLRSASAMATAKRAISIVAAAGGYTASENAVAGSGRSGGTVSLTVKVPVPSYQVVLTELSAPSLGQQISLTQQASDVTQQVANVASLVTSQEDAITALQGLLRRAASVPQLLQVQQQISGDESSLESLQAQQRALDHETSYATVSMTLLSTHHAAARKHKQGSHGFGAGLAAGWRALRHTTTAVLTGLGAALPFLIVLLILAGAGYAGRRRFTRHRPGPTAAS
jgi:Domain of unknown function (DUF4349)